MGISARQLKAFTSIPSVPAPASVWLKKASQGCDTPPAPREGGRGTVRAPFAEFAGSRSHGSWPVAPWGQSHCAYRPPAAALGGYRRAGPRRIHWPLSHRWHLSASLQGIWFTRLWRKLRRLRSPPCLPASSALAGHLLPSPSLGVGSHSSSPSSPWCPCLPPPIC